MVVVLCWALTFLIPAGKFSIHEVEYFDSNGDVKTKTALRADTFRYSYNLDEAFLSSHIPELANNSDKLDELGIDKESLNEFLQTNPSDWEQDQFDELGLIDYVGG